MLILILSQASTKLSTNCERIISSVHFILSTEEHDGSHLSHLVYHTTTGFRLQAIALDDAQLDDEERLRQVDFEQQNTAQHRLLEIIRLLLRVLVVSAKKTRDTFARTP